MKYILMLMFCILSGLVSKSQLPPVQELFVSDSPTVYIGVVNKFTLHASETIKQVEKTRGLDVRIAKDTIEIRTFIPGFLPATFQTDEGIRKVCFIARYLSPPAKKE